MFITEKLFGSRKPDEDGTANGFFIQTQLLPLLIQLQKETRGRRFREIQAPLQEALTSLLTFQSEEWPPKDSHESAGGQMDDDDAIEISTTATDVSEVSEASVEGEESLQTDPDSSKSISRKQPTDDDPQTKEPMHESVILVLEALMSVVTHPSKTPAVCELALDGITRLVNKGYVSGRAGRSRDESVDPSLLHRILESVTKCNEITATVVQAAVLSTLRAILISPKCGVHENAMLMVLRTTFHVYLVVSDEANREMARETLQDILRVVFTRMEAFDKNCKDWQSQQEAPDTSGNTENDVPSPAKDEPSGHEENEPSQPDSTAFPSQYHSDCYALFRMLCKMSSKELPADTADEPDRSRILFASSQSQTDPLALNSKILALECILVALETYCGPAFCQSDRFGHLVQHYLCVSLLKNCVSHHSQIAFVSQKIFVVLIHKFRGQLKEEIAVFLSHVFLRVLDSPNMSFKQKAVVLESLRGLCGDPFLLTQIFLHYDCDFDAPNLYKDIVHSLTKLGGKATSSTPSANKKEAEQEFELSLESMEVLVTILKAFLQALGLNVENKDEADDLAGGKIREMLHLKVKLASRDKNAGNQHKLYAQSSGGDSVASSDLPSSQPVPLSAVKTTETESSAEGAGRIVDAFETKRRAEQNFEIGAVKFTLSLKNGLLFFIENKFVDLDARAIARFFLVNRDKLDKTQMGEALGREPDAAFIKEEGLDPDKGGPGFWLRILHHYVDAQEFTGLMFDDAIRSFLSGFRLPGEAQKIDRIMEKFAERFTSQNPEVFPSADTAFILAFSVIMLNTDLHNPSIKPEKRMTVDSFVKNNRGIGDNGSDLPEDFLKGIFDRIKERPFSLKEDDMARERAGPQRQIFDTSAFFDGSALFGATDTEEKKRERFKQERDEMMAATQKLIRQRPTVSEKSSLDATKMTESISPADVVKPMFDVTWGPMIGILSQVLECSDEERMVAVCLNGFQYAVKLASPNHMSLTRDTFVSSLAKFTFLGSIKEMKQKNVESIRTLLEIAISDGEHLGDSWGSVLQCISQLARLRLSASGLDSDETFLVEKDKLKPSPTATKMGGFFRSSSSRSQQFKIDSAKETEEMNGRAVLESVQEVLIDKVFSSTVNLSARSLAHFISQLISVSSTEIGSSSKRNIAGVESLSGGAAISDASRRGKGDGPSIFSLQRLVDVADYNMDVRPRLVWAQIWELMADYFAQNACHSNAMVSVFAIDSLKQLSFKFLDKPELSEFNFQRLFLNPFLVVMENKESREDIRDLVLQCIDTIVRTKACNLRSGWKVVFSILTCSANDPSEKIEYLGIAILQRLLDEHLDEVFRVEESRDSAQENADLSSTEKRHRNVNAEDFVNLCKTSLAFVVREGSDLPRPVGLSMRALCHTAIYADVLAARRILPPETNTQCDNAAGSGFSYEELSHKEALEMVLWRPIFEGLSRGVQVYARGDEGGVGGLIARSSLLAFRAILMRHHQIFTASQLAAIFNQTLIPCFQVAVENDRSHVIRIISESPTVSNVDFIETPLPPPPPVDDPKLQMFEEMTSQKRSMGPAEIMLEASFTDLRHGGDGDLRLAYELAKRNDVANGETSEQPFPDSWVATTAVFALGLLTDVASLILPSMGESDIGILWPIVSQVYRLWFTGTPHPQVWQPCEALIRIASQEVGRLSEVILETNQSAIWISLISSLYSDLLTESRASQQRGHRNLTIRKEATVPKPVMPSPGKVQGQVGSKIETSYGLGEIIQRRQNAASKQSEVVVVALEWNATLYLSTSNGQIAQSPKEMNHEDASVAEAIPTAYYEATVPDLKVRCIGAFCLNQSLLSVLPFLIPATTDHAMISTLLQSVLESRNVAAELSADDNVATAFQEALVSDWGDGVAMPDVESAARESLHHGSAVFFLAQEAIAAKAAVLLLSMLYVSPGKENGWSKPNFAEPYLLSFFQETMEKFLESEYSHGHLVDPNAWRYAGERIGKPALYCTYFVPVIKELLKMVNEMSTEQIARHKQIYFSGLCKLIRVRSEEIRFLVQEIFETKIAPMIGAAV